MTEHGEGMANSRVPPTWSLENDRRYPLRYYRQDLELWSASTDIEEQRKGPVALLRITGAARTILREMPVHLLQQGQQVTDDFGNVIRITGLEFLLRALERRYGALAEEVQIHAISELMAFTRHSGESTDECLARFDVLLFRGSDIAGVTFSPPIRAWLTLTHLKIPRPAWTNLLVPTEGRLPTTEAEFTDFRHYVRRNGHLHDSFRGDSQKSIAQPFFVGENSDSSEVPHYARAYAAITTGGESTIADDNISWHSFSTGNSDQDEPVDWEEMQEDEPYIGERIYMAYRNSKRQWRQYTGPKRRRWKGKKKRTFFKGHRKGKGKHHHDPHPRAFWTDDAGTAHPYDESSTESTQHMEEVYFKGRGKGNPIGKDGKTMLCSICDSDQHFRAKCPRRGKGSSKGSSGFSSGHGKGKVSATMFADSSSAAQPATYEQPIQHPSYFIRPEIRPEPQQTATRSTSHIYFADGSESIKLQAPPTAAQAYDIFSDEEASTSIVPHENPQAERWYAYAWFGETLYHAHVRLHECEALLIDTGAVHDISGDKQMKKFARIALENGQGSEFKPLQHRTSIEGVGGTPSHCSQTGVVPIKLGDGKVSSYKATIIEDSDVPALLGLATMPQERVLLDLIHDRYIKVGPGGFKLELSPGSTVLELKRAPTGHLMLPATKWGQSKSTSKSQ